MRLPDSGSEKQIKQKIKECILAGKSELFRKTGVTTPEDCLY